MEINKENYEAFLLDLWEGTISEEEKMMLFLFLEKHPELDEDDALNLLNDVSITQSNEVFDKSAIRFDEINLKNYEFFFIAYAEGDLSKNEMSSVDDFVKANPEVKKKFEQFNKAKLPLETFKYPNKKKLIIGQTRLISLPIQRFIIGLAAAAIAFLIYLNIPTNDTFSKYEMSNYEKLEIEKFDFIPQASEKTINYQLAEGTKDERDLKDNSTIFAIENELTPSTPFELVSQQNEKSKTIEELSEQNNQEFGKVSNLEPKEISEITASVVQMKKIQLANEVKPTVTTKEKIPTLVDLTAKYLQEKKILNEERKPDIPGIINSFSNENKKPIILIEEKDDSKTTIFRLGAIKVERKKRK